MKIMKIMKYERYNTKGLRWEGTTGHSADDLAQGPASRRSNLTVKEPLVKALICCFMSHFLICDFLLHFLPRKRNWYKMYKSLICLAANANIKTFDEMSDVSLCGFPSRT